MTQNIRQIQRRMGEHFAYADAFVDGRELARQGKIQRSHTKYMKVGELFDYYTQSNGDKKQGKVTKLSSSSVTVGGETFEIV